MEKKIIGLGKRREGRGKRGREEKMEMRRGGIKEGKERRRKIINK